MMPPLKCLLGYKFSQDHLELFFCAVRGRGGWNNNPTARQFKAAYKRLIVHQEVKSVSTGNCIPQLATDILTISSKISQKEDETDAYEAIQSLRSVGLDPDGSREETSGATGHNIDHDYDQIPEFKQLSPFVENVVVYIAGFVVKKLLMKVSCADCKSALTLLSSLSANECEGTSNLCLLTKKNRGGLKTPSADVVSVCQLSEKCFRSLLHSNCNKPPSGHRVKSALVIQILSLLVDSDVFACLHEHLLYGDPTTDHRVRLMKQVCMQYLSIRFYNAGKTFTQQLQGDKVRSVLNKTILFKGQ
jgi:hypothetical protein